MDVLGGREARSGHLFCKTVVSYTVLNSIYAWVSCFVYWTYHEVRENTNFLLRERDREEKKRKKNRERERERRIGRRIAHLSEPGMKRIRSISLDGVKRDAKCTII